MVEVENLPGIKEPEIIKGHFDVCVVGAGVAGSALAAFLAKNGKHVAVIEKDLSEQDRIVGELLQPDGVEKLRAMGLDDLLEGFDAQSIHGYAIFMGDKHIQIPYPEDDSQAHPFKGRGFRNGKFITRMRQHLLTHPMVKVLEGTVTDLYSENEEVKGVNFAMGEKEYRVYAPITVVCDGFFSKFRQELSQNKAVTTGFFLGILLKNAHLPFPGHGHVIITGQTPFLAYPVSSEETRVLIDFPGKQPPRKGPELMDFLRNELYYRVPDSLKKAFLDAIEEGKFKVMPNHFMPAKPSVIRGAVLLGDSLNMRHPLTGGGMTVALSDVYSLGSLILGTKNLHDPKQLENTISQYYSDKRKPNSSINILADALYGVFRNKDLSKACFDYLKKGGSNAKGPVSILSGISRNQILLQQHFFSVALYGAGRVVLPFPTPSRIHRAYRMIGEAMYIMIPLIENESYAKNLKWFVRLGKWAFPEKQFIRN